MNEDDCRYRLYRRRDGELQLLCTTDTAQGLGLALVTMFEEDEFEQGDRVGILDRPADVKKGKWIIDPFYLPV